MKIGITGWRGFVGTNLLKRLEDHQCNLFIGNLEKDLEQIEEFVSDIDIVVHLAGVNRGEPADIVAGNFIASHNLISYCFAKKVPMIIAGSDYKKNDVYKTSKDVVSLICENYAYVGLKSIVLKFPKLIGPHCKPYYNSFVTTLIYLASKGKLKENLHLIKDMNEVVELLHVDDACDVILDCIKSPPKGFEQYTFNTFDKLLKPNFREIVQILETDYQDMQIDEKFLHKYYKPLQELKQWYKENNIYGESK